MNTAELHDSLNDEQKLALLALRDEMLTANNAAIGDAVAAVNAERDRLTGELATAAAKGAADLQAAKDEAETQKTRDRNAYQELNAVLIDERKTAKLNSEGASAVIESLTEDVKQVRAERDEQVKRAQGIAARAKAARERRKQADAAYAEIDEVEDALIAEASQGLDEQAEAAKEAKRAALQAEIDKLK